MYHIIDFPCIFLHVNICTHTAITTIILTTKFIDLFFSSIPGTTDVGTGVRGVVWGAWRIGIELLVGGNAPYATSTNYARRTNGSGNGNCGDNGGCSWRSLDLVNKARAKIIAPPRQQRQQHY